jgi:hypothetical protein
MSKFETQMTGRFTSILTAMIISIVTASLNIVFIVFELIAFYRDTSSIDKQFGVRLTIFSVLTAFNMIGFIIALMIKSSVILRDYHFPCWQKISLYIA